MVNKTALVIVIGFAWVYLAIYLFNHFTAWGGIALFAIGLLVVANYIQKKIKNNQ